MLSISDYKGQYLSNTSKIHTYSHFFSYTSLIFIQYHIHTHISSVLSPFHNIHNNLNTQTHFLSSITLYTIYKIIYTHRHIHTYTTTTTHTHTHTSTSSPTTTTTPITAKLVYPEPPVPASSYPAMHPPLSCSSPAQCRPPGLEVRLCGGEG